MTVYTEEERKKVLLKVEAWMNGELERRVEVDPDVWDPVDNDWNANCFNLEDLLDDALTRLTPSQIQISVWIDEDGNTCIFVPEFDANVYRYMTEKTKARAKNVTIEIPWTYSQ